MWCKYYLLTTPGLNFPKTKDKLEIIQVFVEFICLGSMVLKKRFLMLYLGETFCNKINIVYIFCNINLFLRLKVALKILWGKNVPPFSKYYWFSGMWPHLAQLFQFYLRRLNENSLYHFLIYINRYTTNCYYTWQTLQTCYDKSKYYSTYLNTNIISIDDFRNLTYTIKSK